MTVTIEGVPQLAQLEGGIVKPLGGVDLDNSIGGCAVGGGKAAIAIPQAKKVITVDMKAQPGPLSEWAIAGKPDTIVDGEYGRISHLAVIEGSQGFEIWAATTNRTTEDASAKDDRVIRLPQGGAAGGSPD